MDFLKEAFWDLSYLQYLVYINDLPDVVQNIAKHFADDTKLYTVVNEEEQQISLQNDIDSLEMVRQVVTEI